MLRGDGGEGLQVPQLGEEEEEEVMVDRVSGIEYVF